MAKKKTSAKKAASKKSASSSTAASKKKKAASKTDAKKSASTTARTTAKKPASGAASTSSKKAPTKSKQTRKAAKTSNKKKAPPEVSAAPQTPEPADAETTSTPPAPVPAPDPVEQPEPAGQAAGAEPGGNGQPAATPTVAEMLADPNHEPPSVEELKKVKTGLTKNDLEHFRQLLLEHRAELLGDVESLTDERKSTTGNISNLPLHMADIGADHYDQEFTLGLLASERKLLAEIEDALYRMEEGYYGVCLETGLPIARTRLEAKPWAQYCIEVVREKERRGEL